MTDPKTGSKLITLNLPDGTERHLKKLSPSDWLKLGNSLQTIRKAEKRAEIAETNAAIEAAAGSIASILGQPDAKDKVRGALAQFGVSDDAGRAELAKIDKTPVRRSDVEKFLNTMSGQYTAILLALARDNPEILRDPALGEEEMEKLGITVVDWRGLMMELCDMEEMPVPLPASPEEKNLGATSPTSGTSMAPSPGTSAVPMT